MTRRGVPIVLAAASGAGKTTLGNRLLRRVEGLELSISYTTRAPRGQERDGIEYHFVDEPTFKQMIEQQRFIEWARVHSHFYGSGLDATQRRLDLGIDVLFDIDVQGARQLKTLMPQALLLWVDAPSWQVLEQRLRGRGTDDETAIQKRLRNARGEREAAIMFFDHIIINDDLEKATLQMVEVIDEQRARQ